MVKMHCSIHMACHTLVLQEKAMESAEHCQVFSLQEEHGIVHRLQQTDSRVVLFNVVFCPGQRFLTLVIYAVWLLATQISLKWEGLSLSALHQIEWHSVMSVISLCHLSRVQSPCSCFKMHFLMLSLFHSLELL